MPEIASRAHLELLGPVVKEAMDRAEVAPSDLSAVAATIGPGLVGSLLVGVSVAKAYAWSWGLPFVGVNHMEGHLHAAFVKDPALSFPTVVLLVSGGHTMLICMQATQGKPNRPRTSWRPLTPEELSTAYLAKRWTMPPVRLSTRWPASSAWATPADRR